MTRKKTLALLLLCTWLTGCVSDTVARGAAIGALAGAAAGATVGVLITDEDLLGSSSDPATGAMTIPPAEGILGGIALGAVFGALVGAMAGSMKNDRYSDIVILDEDAMDDDDEEDLGMDEDEAVRPGPLMF